VSKEEAFQYLKLRKIDEEQATQIHELVGGRMIHLKSIADGIRKNVTLEAMRKTIFSSVKEQLESAEILPELRYHKEGALIIRELLKKESISRDTLYKLVGVSTARKLLKTIIFAYHFNSREITFQSIAMKRFCEENSARWESNA
jgi:coenzyme F420-reducing hydrogenase alpha subunit